MVLVLIFVELQLCSDIPGGKDAWNAEQGKVIPIVPVEETEVKEVMMEKDDSMVEESHEEEMTEADLGSVLRLSRANVPATIPLHHGYYNGEEVYLYHH